MFNLPFTDERDQLHYPDSVI